MKQRYSVIFCLALIASAEQSQKPITIEVLLETSCQVGGISTQDPVSNQKLCFDTAPILTQDDLKSAVLNIGANGKPQVVATMKDSAAERVYRITQANIGHHAAVLINKHIAESPYIKVGLRTIIAFQGFSEQQAQEIAKQINQKR